MEQNQQLWRLGGPERFECQMCRLQILNNPHADSEGGGGINQSNSQSRGSETINQSNSRDNPPPTGASAGVSATLLVATLIICIKVRTRVQSGADSGVPAPARGGAAGGALSCVTHGPFPVSAFALKSVHVLGHLLCPRIFL